MRIFRLVATPVLLLGLLAFLVWGASWGWRNLTAPLPTPEPTPCVTETVEVVTPANVHLRVYNGGFTSGLATRQAQRLEAAGFVVVRTGNTDERIKGTVIRGNKTDDPAVQLVASYFKDATVEYDERVDGTVDVLVGSEFAGNGESPLPQVETSTGTVCVPPSPAPSDSVSPPQASPSASATS